ncbi:CidA/LrgA family protein [Paracoccus sp. 1_MG-2023]|uniref:CidA/LrgA family protein n=1 Tax=unclassified Paracoccus (in: a-proteobacteria) TaxID=2688777 RepID=UPI001C097720|nr:MULTISPECIES: CidA/LrgA family protein [unclassified Paracoccus (in: a-proteobacteria)]MBU2957054.1 CidA/LrgA family protein [Paracoccus sp. C2R09]MDO6668252.1 CidA/LrgA family protein [Paracoccus sp. 1_MG-2023]
MIAGLAIILCFQLVGEVATRALGLPVPGPVLGMILMVVAGMIRPALITRIRPVAQGLLANLSLFFVPAGVGVVAHVALIREQGIALALAITLSTLLAIGIGALVFQWVSRLTGTTDPNALKSGRGTR